MSDDTGTMYSMEESIAQFLNDDRRALAVLAIRRKELRAALETLRRETEKALRDVDAGEHIAINHWIDSAAENVARRHRELNALYDMYGIFSYTLAHTLPPIE